MNKGTVMVVDDDARIRELLRLYLERADFAVTEAENGVAALLQFQQSKPDLIVLDIMMPVLDGLETCRQIRKNDSIPIILLTAKTDDENKLIGFESGADDYIGKPFFPKEVVARVQAILRRTQPPVEEKRPPVPPIICCRLGIDSSSRTVTRAEESIELTVKEFDLLYTLASQPGRVLTRELLLSAVWGYDEAGDTRTVDVHVQRLRQKLRNGICPAWNIATVWGLGYRFEYLPSLDSEQSKSPC